MWVLMMRESGELLKRYDLPGLHKYGVLVSFGAEKRLWHLFAEVPQPLLFPVAGEIPPFSPDCPSGNNPPPFTGITEKYLSLF